MDAAEYEHRRAFCDLIKSLGRAEMIEVARLLRKNNVSLSENRSGIFFDMAAVSDTVFEKLQKFYDFVQQNNTELLKREIEAEPKASAKEII